MQRPAGRVVKELHAAVIADEPIVVPRPPQLGLECLHRKAQLLVTVCFNPFSHPLHSGQPFLSGRASLHPRFALPIRFPVELESQKVKPPIVRPTIGPEAQRLGFIRGNFQSKFGQPCFQGLLKGLCLVPIFKARHKIIRIASQRPPAKPEA